MDLNSKKNVRALLKKYQIRPQKHLGQNFLIDRGVARKIVEAAELNSQDIVLEIGPGIGTLTQELAKRAKKVMAVEKDRNMIAILGETLKHLRNVKLVQADIRRLPTVHTQQINSKIQIPKQYKIVGNLPFYLTAPVIRQFLERTEARPLYARPKLMVLVVQKEVAQRICAQPPRMNLLAISVQIYAKPKIISYISRKSFWPQPEVDAAIIKLKVKNQKLKVNKNLFFKIVRAGFSQPRKQLINNLSKGLKIDKKRVAEWLIKNGIQPSQRAETLGVDDWISLTKNIKIN